LLQAATRQFKQHRRFTLGAEQADLDHAIGRLGVLQVQVEALHATVATTEEGGQIAGQTP
jgi:hypothetical protein